MQPFLSGHVPSQPQLPDALLQADTVGVMYDEVDGLTLLTDFGLIEEAFERPELARRGPHKEAVLGYLTHDTVPPSGFRHLAARSPAQISEMVCCALGSSRFRWEVDGESLLGQHKAAYFQRTPQPRVIPLTPDVARAQMKGGDERTTGGYRGCSNEKKEPAKLRRIGS